MTTTAETCAEAAAQRAEYLAINNANQVLELCVGPSIHVLRRAYGRLGLSVRGNDIDERWNPDLLGHCLTIDWTPYDWIVFAPPLSRNCTGRREDALCIDDVTPRYDDYLARLRRTSKCGVMVLPARSWGSSQDRRMYHRLLAAARRDYQVEVRPLYAGRRQIRKYIDLYLTPTGN